MSPDSRKRARTGLFVDRRVHRPSLLRRPAAGDGRFDGRVLRLCRLPGQSRIRVTFASVRPHYVGIVADLDTEAPRFIGAPEHLDWAKTAGHTRCMLDEAVLAYAHRDRAELPQCEVSESPDSVV